MRPPLRHPVFAAMLVFAILLTGRVAAEESAPGTTLNLLEFLREKDQSKPVVRARLSPEWVGTIRGGEEEPRHLRLTHAGRSAKKEGEEKGSVWAARMRENGSYIGSDYAEFRSKLPTAEELKAAKRLSQLFTLLGPHRSNFILDGWDDGERLNWNEGWSYFTTADKGTLRWLAVSTSVSSKSGEKKPAPEQTRVDELEIREGILRPATPGLAPEEDLFKNADQLHEIEERAKQAERAKIPQPLRDLVAAEDAPDDSDLKIFAAAINKVRKNPEAEIFRQMAVYDDSGRGFTYLAYVLLDEIPGVGKWTPENRSKAMRHAVDALSAAPDGDHLQSMSETLLEVMGGGDLKIASPEMDLKVEIRDGSKSMSYSQWNVDEGNLPQAAKAVADWFKGKLK